MFDNENHPYPPPFPQTSRASGHCHVLKNVELSIADTFIDIWVEEQERGILRGQSVLVVVRPFIGANWQQCSTR